MKLQEYVVNRKYTMIAFAVIIVFFGILAKMNIPIELFPNTAPPIVNVVTAYPGASAQDVSTEVTEVIEEEVTTVSGVETVKSTSQDGLSLVTVEFAYGTDSSSGTVDIQNVISRIRNRLPNNIQEPQVLEVDVSDKPIMTLALSSEQLSLMEVRSLAGNEIKNMLQLVPGVAAVDAFGGYEEQVSVNILPEKLRQYNLSTQQVIQAISKNNLSFPGGKIKNDKQQFNIRINNDITNQSQLKNIMVSKVNGRPIFLGEIAQIEQTSQEATSSFRYQSSETIAVQIIKKDGANTVEVIENVRQELDKVANRFNNVNIAIADDDSKFTTQVISNMTSSIGIAISLTVLIIMLFVLSFHKALAVSISIPLSYMLTLALMNIFNLQLDLITLSAIILSIGIVVDNAIVVVENISRHNEELGKSLKQAAIDGASEITLSVMAGTATTLVVMLPLIFIEGFVGKVFGPLAKTIIFSIGSSLIVSLSVIPLFLVLTEKINFATGDKWARRIGKPFAMGINMLRILYLSILDKAIARPKSTLVIVGLLLVLSAKVLTGIGMDVLPKMDTGNFSIWIETESGYNLNKTKQIVRQVETLLDRNNEVTDYYSQIGYETGTTYMGENGAMGVNQGNIAVTLTSRKERDRTIWQIEEDIRQEIARIPGIKIFVVKEEGGTAVATSRAPVDIRISGPDQRVLEQVASDIKEQVNAVPGVVNLYNSWSRDTETLVLQLDQSRMIDLGLHAAAVANQVFQSIEGVSASELKRNDSDDLRIFVQYPDEKRKNRDLLGETVITTSYGVTVPLRDIAEIKTVTRANLVTRENLNYTIDLLGFTHQRPLSHVVSDVESVLKEITIPQGYELAVVGDQAELLNSRNDLAFAMLIALVSVFLLLMVQFRSATHPLTIMAAIPLVLIGVLIALKLSGKVISMPVMLGFILLAGTVVNNAILLIDQINLGRQDSLPINKAVHEAVDIRFRPIMMTALSDVAGMTPLASELALGSERFSPLAVTVIGGILAATFLTLIIIPVVYILVEKAKSRLFSGKKQGFCLG